MEKINLLNSSQQLLASIVYVLLLNPWLLFGIEVKEKCNQ